MPIVPLFVADQATLIKQLRQPGAAENPNSPVLPLIETAHLKARVELLNKVGLDAITAIQGTAFTSQPTTAAQIQRATANMVETELTRYYLLPEVRVFFASGTSVLGEAFNTGFLMSLSEDGFRLYMDRLRAEIDQSLTLLIPSPNVNSVGLAPGVSGVIEPACLPPRLGPNVQFGVYPFWRY